MGPDTEDDALTFLITPHGAHTDPETDQRHKIVLSVDRNGSNKLHYSGAYVVPGWGPRDPPLPAHVGGVSLEADIVLEQGQQGAIICAYILPESSMNTDVSREVRYPPLPLGPASRPQRPARDLVPARVCHLSGPALTFPNGWALEPWTQLVVEVGDSQLLWPGGMQRVFLGPEREVLQWQPLDAVRDKEWICGTPVKGMLRWFSPSDLNKAPQDADSDQDSADEEPEKDYAARHPLVLELLADVRPFYPGSDPADQPELFPALVVEVCLGAAWAQSVTGYVEVDGVRYYTVNPEAHTNIASQLDTNILEEDTEAAMQLDQEEADWELEKQQQAAGGFK